MTNIQTYTHPTLNHKIYCNMILSFSSGPLASHIKGQFGIMCCTAAHRGVMELLD